ncbi:conserved hypothetical protein [Coccidioides posadasii str. Silveira]|uniref:Uncharacterized protein n=1 Tax=Coccidioides posadasii (strain RMSCC 757 / Silveira) TaxID=443226 RepID=E9D5P2_COCPS|nr:conserved hypothetical protein [Coccidioides posadasii str. Silveira]
MMKGGMSGRRKAFDERKEDQALVQPIAWVVKASMKFTTQQAVAGSSFPCRPQQARRNSNSQVALSLLNNSVWLPVASSEKDAVAHPAQRNEKVDKSQRWAEANNNNKNNSPHIKLAQELVKPTGGYIV